MGNALAQFANSAVADVNKLDEALDAGLANAPKVPTASAYMRLDQKSGKWVFGQENIAVEDDSLWAANPYSFQHGYVNWSNPKVTGKKAELLGEMFVPFNASLPLATTLENFSSQGGQWNDAIMFDLICMSGEDEGTQVTYNGSSMGACRAYAELLAKVKNRPEQDYPFPVAVLTETSYDSKYGSKVYNPIFDVVDWANNEGALLTGDTPEAAPANAETQEGPPVRQRRRRG
jgi:hypothetical protein